MQTSALSSESKYNACLGPVYICNHIVFDTVTPSVYAAKSGALSKRYGYKYHVNGGNRVF